MQINKRVSLWFFIPCEFQSEMELSCSQTPDFYVLRKLSVRSGCSQDGLGWFQVCLSPSPKGSRWADTMAKENQELLNAKIGNELYSKVFPDVKILFNSVLIHIFDRNIQFNTATKSIGLVLQPQIYCMVQPFLAKMLFLWQTEKVSD